MRHQVVYNFEGDHGFGLTGKPETSVTKSAISESCTEQVDKANTSQPTTPFTTKEENEQARKKAEIANKETRKKVSALLEALFASLLQDDNKESKENKKSKSTKRIENKNQLLAKDNEDSEEEEDEVIKVNIDHSRINRARKSLDKAVDLQKLPVIQEELTWAKKLNTNDDADYQSPRSPPRESINLDLGQMDSSWMEAGGLPSDSDADQEPHEPIQRHNTVADFTEMASAPSLPDLVESGRAAAAAADRSPLDSERADSGLGLTFEALELSLSREGLAGGEDWEAGQAKPAYRWQNFSSPLFV